MIPAPPASPTDTRRSSGSRREIPAFVPSTPGLPVPAAGWSLVLADGSRVTVPQRLVLGRRPEPDGEWADAAVVAVDDPGRSVSKTHAALVRDGDDLLVVDLHSTNGVVVVTGDGEETTLSAGGRHRIREDATIELGRYAVRVARA